MSSAAQPPPPPPHSRTLVASLHPTSSGNSGQWRPRAARKVRGLVPWPQMLRLQPLIARARSSEEALGAAAGLSKATGGASGEAPFLPSLMPYMPWRRGVTHPPSQPT
jgi:hypothetical protein